MCASFNLEIVNKKIKKAIIAYGENFLNNTSLSLDSFEKAKIFLEKDFTPIDDMRATKDYRIEVAKNLLIKFF